jgi:hypothetical protein
VLIINSFSIMAKREQIEPHPGDKRYVRRNEEGQIKESDDLNRSLSRDDQRNAKTTTTPGQGDRGDGHTGNRRPAR